MYIPRKLRLGKDDVLEKSANLEGGNQVACK